MVYNVRTYQTTVGGLFAEIQLPVTDQDIVTPASNTALQSGLIISVDRPDIVVVEEDGIKQKIYTRGKPIPGRY